MIDPSSIRLNETLHRERLQAAAEARRWRAIAAATPSPIERLQQALGTSLIRLGQRLQMPSARPSLYR